MNAPAQTPSRVETCNPWFRGRNIVELVSASFDPDMQGVGSSPTQGDVSSTGVVVPAEATENPNERYLFRLCGIDIPLGGTLIIHGLRQAVTLRGSDEETGAVAELDVTSPFWHFSDGNVSFHVYWQKDVQSKRRFDPNQVAGTSPDFHGLDTALVYLDEPPDYLPLNAGLPMGEPVEYLGTIRDLRYPWTNFSRGLHVEIRGPGRIVYYASVKQTSPSLRTDPPEGALRPEDQFVLAFPNAVYGRVAGAMAVELISSKDSL